MADKKSYGNPTWLKWLVTAFIAYAVYMHFTGQQMTPSAPKERGKAGLTETSRKATTPPEISDLSVKIGGDIKGSGDEAQCGQSAVVRVAGTFPDGKNYEGPAVSAEPLEVKVGAQDGAHPWVKGLPGMSAGGVREVILPAQDVLDEKTIAKHGYTSKDTMRFRVQLDRLTPSADHDAIPLRVMDTLPDKGMMAYCGDTVSIHLVLWKSDGTVLYDSGKEKPLTMRLGDTTIFYGLDRALLGMREGGVRTAIIPPAYVTGAGGHAALKAVPPGQLVIADISLAKVEKPAK